MVRFAIFKFPVYKLAYIGCHKLVDPLSPYK